MFKYKLLIFIKFDLDFYNCIKMKDRYIVYNIFIIVNIMYCLYY